MAKKKQGRPPSSGPLKSGETLSALRKHARFRDTRLDPRDRKVYMRHSGAWCVA